MLTVALVLFVLGATGGLFLATRILTKKSVPVPIVALHGLAGASGLVVLLFAVIASANLGPPALSLGILIVTALGGFWLLSFHLRKKPWPVPLVLIHGLAAATGVTILLLTILGLFS